MDPGLVCWCIVQCTRRYVLRPPGETGGETKRESFPKATVGPLELHIKRRFIRRPAVKSRSEQHFANP